MSNMRRFLLGSKNDPNWHKNVLIINLQQFLLKTPPEQSQCSVDALRVKLEQLDKENVEIKKMKSKFPMKKRMHPLLKELKSSSSDKEIEDM